MATEVYTTAEGFQKAVDRGFEPATKALPPGSAADAAETAEDAADE